MHKKGEFGIFLAKILSGLPGNQQTIYSWLYYRKNKQNLCYPSLNCIARDTGIKSRTTVCKHLASLEKIGLIKRTIRKKEDGTNDSTTYEVFAKPIK